MNSNDFLKLANAARPDLVEKTATALAVLEKMAPEFADELKDDMDKILSRPSEHMEKNAGAAASIVKAYGSIPAPVKGALALGLGSAAAGLGGALATDLYDAAKRGLSKGRNFKRILDANPELAKGYERSTLSRSYSTLHRYAPEFTSDSLMGATILKAMAETPGNEMSIIEKLINSRKNLLDAKSRQFSPGKIPLKEIKDITEGKKGVVPNTGG